MRLLLLAVEQSLFRWIFCRFRFPQRTGNDPDVRELAGQVSAEDLQPVPEVPVVVEILKKTRSVRFNESLHVWNEPRLTFKQGLGLCLGLGSVT